VNGLALARVVETHPESHSVSVVIMETQQRITGVQVLAGVAGSDFGFTDMSEPDATGYEAKNSGTRDIFAVVGYVNRTPVVVGYLYPQVAQNLFREKGRMIYRHGSDVMVTVDAGGNTQIAHPSGAFIRIGESPDFEDLAGKDYDGKFKTARNTDKQVSIRVSNGGGTLTMDPSGHVTVQASGVSIISDVAVTGNVTVSGDVVASGKSLVHHTHGGVQAGGAQSGQPS
jgi:hypothetical protein